MPWSEICPSGFLVLLTNPDPILAAEACDCDGVVAGSGFVLGFLTVGTWQPDDCVIGVSGLAVFGAWVKVDTVGSRGGLQ